MANYLEAANVIEINDLENLEALLRQKDIASGQIVHWQNGKNPQEAYLRIENLNGKRTACHYDIDGRPIIMNMKQRITDVLGVKPIDLSGLERIGAGLYNPGGFSADQPLIVGEESKREHAQSVLKSVPVSQLEAIALRATAATESAAVAKEATEVAKSGMKLFGLFGKKPETKKDVVPAPKQTIGKP